MDFERTPTLTMQFRTLRLWLCVAIAYVGWIAVILLVMFQMASGYGSSFLGTGTPPNSVEFRRAVGQFAFLAYLLSTGGAAFAIWHGDRTVRWAAAIPATLSALALLLVIIGKLA